MQADTRKTNSLPFALVGTKPADPIARAYPRENCGLDTEPHIRVAEVREFGTAPRRIPFPLVPKHPSSAPGEPEVWQASRGGGTRRGTSTMDSAVLAMRCTGYSADLLC